MAERPCKVNQIAGFCGKPALRLSPGGSRGQGRPESVPFITFLRDDCRPPGFRVKYAAKPRRRQPDLPDRMMQSSVLKKLRPFWPLAMLAGLAAAAVASGLHESLTLESLVRHRAAIKAWIAAHPVLAPAVFMLAYAAAVTLAMPGAAVLTVAGGFLFGWLWGSLFTMVGATLGALALFLAARTALGDRLRARAGGALDRIKAGFHEDAASYLLFLRLAPVFPFFIVNLAAAALNAPLMTFLWTTFIGIIPAVLAFALAGAGLDSAIAQEIAAYDQCVAVQKMNCTLNFSLASLLTPSMAAALGALGLVALLPVLVKRWRSRTAPAENP